MAFGNLKKLKKKTYEKKHHDYAICFEISRNNSLKFLQWCRGYDTGLSRERPKFDFERRYTNLIFASFKAFL